VAIRLPANDVDDPTEAIVAILEYLSYLHTVPEIGSEHLSLIYAESCDCYGEVLGFLDEYLEKGWTQDDEGIAVEEAIITQEFENGNVLLQVTDSWSPQYVRNADGVRIRLVEDEWSSEVSLVGLERGTDGRWRVGVIGVIGQQSS
jgi:hypothetical protein